MIWILILVYMSRFGYLFNNSIDISQQAYYRLFWNTDLFFKYFKTNINEDD